jgi:transposase
MLKAYEYRIYPNSQQEELFNQTLGLCRLYWNTVVFNKNQNHNMLKESRKLCNEFQTVVVEDINLQTMSKMNHGVVIGDQGFGMFREMVAYKGELVKVNPKNTSKTCHICGFVNPKVKVGVNYWKCPVCGESHDRDINAALNILSKYVTSQSIVGWELTEIRNACGGPRSSMKQENELTSAS